MSNLEQIRDTVRDEHCPMCGTQRCDGSDEMMEGCGHYAHLQGKETEHEKLMKIMKEELQKEKGSDLEQKVREVLGLCAYTAPRNREIIDQSVTAIMEEVGKEGCDCNNCMSECKEIVGLRAEVSHLKAHQADCDEAYKTVMDERCSANEVHCTCVPFLRVGIAQLKAEIKRLKGCEKDSCKCIKCGVTMVEYQKYHELCPICFVETTQQ